MYRAIVVILALSCSACGLFKKKPKVIPGENSPEQKEIYYQAETLYINGNYAEATALFEKFVATSPRPASGYYRLACIKHKENKNDDALKLSHLAQLADTANLYTYLLFDADIYRSSRDFIAAGDIFSKLAQQTKGRWSLYSDAARMYQNAGNADKLIGLCNLWEKAFGLREDIALSKAWGYLRKGYRDSAAGEYLQLVNKYPERRQYKSWYAKALVDAGQNEKALDIYKKLLADDPENGELLGNLCDYYSRVSDKKGQWPLVQQIAASHQLSLDEKQNCIKQFLIPDGNLWFDSMEPVLQKLTAIHPTDSRAWFMLGDWYYSKNYYKKASDALARSVNMQSNYDAWMKYSNCLERLKFYPRMKNVADSMMELFPSNPEVGLVLAKAYYGMEKWDKAKESCETAISYAIDEDIKHSLSLMLARISNSMGKPEDCYTALKALIKENANDHAAMNELARAYATNHTEVTEALSLINKALLLNSNTPEYFDTRGMVYLESKMTKEAIADFKHSLDLDANNADVWEHLGDAWLAVNNRPEAAECYKKASLIAPGSAKLSQKAASN